MDQEIGCSCTEYLNQNGVGRCQTNTWGHGNRYNCYVRLPSNCTDLVNSSTDPGEKLSAEACDLQGNY